MTRWIRFNPLEVTHVFGVFVSGSRDVLMRRLFQLKKYHLDLALVSDEVGCLKNNLIDTSQAEKVTNNCKQSETRSKSTSRCRNKYRYHQWNHIRLDLNHMRSVLSFSSRMKKLTKNFTLASHWLMMISFILANERLRLRLQLHRLRSDPSIIYWWLSSRRRTKVLSHPSCWSHALYSPWTLYITHWTVRVSWFLKKAKTRNWESKIITAWWIRDWLDWVRGGWW